MRQVNFFLKETYGTLFACSAHKDSGHTLTDFDDTKP